MKKIVVVMLAVATIIFSATAQQKREMKHHKQGHQKGMMLKGLNLSAAQKEQMKASRLSTKNQLAELKKNDNITVKDYNAKKAAIMKTQKEQMEKLLTPEQKNQLAQNKLERKGKHDLISDKKLDKMKTNLNLSDEQVSKLKASQEANKLKATAIKEDSQLSDTEKKAQLMVLKQGQKENFKRVLTPEQLTKMEEKKKAGAGRK